MLIVPTHININGIIRDVTITLYT